MYSLLLALIYVSFISLGLPDSLLGSAWPIMREEMGVPLSYAGFISMTIAGGTIVSSLLSDRLTKKLGPGVVTAMSVFMTAAALFGFSISTTFWMLWLWAVPYGLGAGGVDAALNNYVAVNYASRHMNWLHCFWGVGATTGPYIMSYCLTNGLGFSSGYKTVAFIQITLTAVLFVCLPLWKAGGNSAQSKNDNTPPKAIKTILSIRGVKYILAAFFGYSALESTAGLWASSYLVSARGIGGETAAKYASLFFFGITFGRFLCGFVSNRIGDKNMIRIGIGVAIFGIGAIMLPTKYPYACLFGLIVAGLGCAPIYPAIIHSTPSNFGAENSQALVGVQMASAYTGSTVMPPLFGLAARHITIELYPFFLFAFAVLMLVMTEKLVGITVKNAD